MPFDKVIEQLKGGSGSGNFGHSGRPGKLGGSSGGGKGGGGMNAPGNDAWLHGPSHIEHAGRKTGDNDIPLGGKSKPHSKGFSIKFDDVPGYHKLSAFTDAAMERKLAALEKATGRQVPKDSKTDFPGFIVYEDGEEIGGG